MTDGYQPENDTADQPVTETAKKALVASIDVRLDTNQDDLVGWTTLSPVPAVMPEVLTFGERAFTFSVMMDGDDTHAGFYIYSEVPSLAVTAATGERSGE